MKIKSLTAVALGLCMSLGSLEASATPGLVSETDWSFLGTDKGGTGSATMNIKIFDDNSLTLTLDNISPTRLDDDSGFNGSGIDGFGFNLDPDRTWSSWTLTAFPDSTSLTPVPIGDSSASTDPSDPSYLPWSLAESANNQGIIIDYNPNNGNGVNEALYNPDADLTALPGGNKTIFYTQAIFQIFFDQAPTLAQESCGSGIDCTTFVRMQNVGLDGEGSLKLPGSSSSSSTGSSGSGAGSTGAGVPEPSTHALLGLGILALGFYQRKRKTSLKA